MPEQDKPSTLRRAFRWIGRTSFGTITVRRADVLLAALAVLASLYSQTYVGNPVPLSKEPLLQVDLKTTSDCFKHTHLFVHADERSFVQEGLFRRSVVQYTYLVFRPLPNPKWPGKINDRIATCEAEIGPELDTTGAMNGDTRTIVRYITMAEDRLIRGKWYVITSKVY